MWSERYFCDKHMSGGKHNELPVKNPLSDARIRHDIRASLAISKGMCQALGMSLDELSEVSAIAAREERLNCVEKLERDYRFCLSRILRSLDQLDSTVEGAVIRPAPIVESDIQGTAQ